MYIKQIIIKGFKSYKDQTIMEPFSPGHNVIVGRNGSGKSNFFSAIRFVLHDAYTKLGQEERLALMHEGLVTAEDASGHGHLSGATYVEILFDNSDQRFPTGHDKVTIRRAIGHKKDEYFLDGRSVNKQDITNLLQAAGFSKSNPYYIVPQGRIMALTSAKDSDRLQLLKEVAGTKVYEEHREESLKIMSETDLKREKINELLENINEKINTLEKEKEDLLRYQALDKEKRGLEFVLLRQEKQDVEKALVEYERESAQDIANSEVLLRDLTERETRINILEGEISVLEKELEILNGEYDNLMTDKEELSADIQRLELGLTDSTASKQSRGIQELNLETELKNLENEIITKSNHLEILEQTNSNRVAEESALNTQLTTMTSSRDALIVKRGRSHQFTSILERDNFLKGEIADLENKLAFEKRREVDLLSDISTVSGELNSAAEQKKSIDQIIDRNQEQENTLELKLTEDSRSKDSLIERRKVLWRTESKLESNLPNLKEDLLSAERSLYATLDKNSIQGLESVRKISQRLGLSSAVHGPVYELFEVTEANIYDVCIEAVAGNSLFHIVVDTDDAAEKLLEEMHKDSTTSGRVTFMPLNRISKGPVKRPPTGKNGSSTAMSMLDILSFDNKVYGPVMQHIFGKTWIVESLDVGSQFAASMQVSCITLDGDRVDRKGTLAGGYIDRKGNVGRLASARSSKSILNQVTQAETELATVKSELRSIDQEVTLLSGRISFNDGELLKLKREIDSLYRRRSDVESLIGLLTERLSDKHSKITLIRSSDVLLEKIQSLKVEIGTPLTQKLTTQELEALKDLEIQINILQTELMRKVAERTSSLMVSISETKHSLEQFLLKKRQDVTSQLVKLRHSAKLELSNDQIAAQLQLVKVRHVDCCNLEKSLASTIKKSTEKLDALKKQLDSQFQVANKQAKKTNDLESTLSKWTAKRALLIEKQNAISGKLASLGGIVPADAIALYGKFTVTGLTRQIHSVNDTLRSFGHVNKKAFEQSHAYMKERVGLLTRKAELDESSKSIAAFIRNLDSQKDEAVSRTFDTVSRNFREIFSRLVHDGQAELEMLRDLPGINSNANTSHSSSDTSSIATLVGIGINVTLNGAQMRMQQLSGGQKSIVALSLIFAIQKCDPAPFYLFDEIDANLDASHRKAVAELISEMKQPNTKVDDNDINRPNSVQFITTTFRPEMLVHADKFYGVTFANRVSRVQVISREEASHFIQQDIAM